MQALNTYEYTLKYNADFVVLKQSASSFPHHLHEFACSVPSSKFASVSWWFNGKPSELVLSGSGEKGKKIVSDDRVVHTLPKHTYLLRTDGHLTISFPESDGQAPYTLDKLASVLTKALLTRSKWIVNELHGDKYDVNNLSFEPILNADMPVLPLPYIDGNDYF
jgi:hypothetical protein